MVALQALCHTCQPCEQVSETTGHLKSHEMSTCGWLNWPLINAASGAGKEIHLTSIHGDEMNCPYYLYWLGVWLSCSNVEVLWHLRQLLAPRVSRLIPTDNSGRVANSLVGTEIELRYIERAAVQLSPVDTELQSALHFLENQGEGIGTFIQTFLTPSK